MKLAVRLMVMFFLASLVSVIGAQTGTTPCVLGYSVGFFNGVGNTEVDGADGLNAVQAAVRAVTGNPDDTYHNEPVTYQLYYNHTGSVVGASTAQDVAEVFIQRANELDPSGFFSGNNFYLMWEQLSAPPTFSAVLSPASSPLANFVTNFTNSAISSIVSSLSAALSNPPTAADYATQNAMLDTQAAAGRKFLLVAHSQGNLFVNQAYDHIMPAVSAARVKVVHLAPASPTIRGQYVLSSNDLIINPLRLGGGSASVQPNNITIPFSTADPSGHALVPTYLDQTRNGYAASTGLMLGALSALAPPSCNVTLTPQANTIKPGGTVAYTAAINPTPTGFLSLGYAWSISGNAGGYFTGPNGNVSTISTSAPTITYTAPSTATTAQVDTVKVTAYATKQAGNTVNAEALGSAASTVTIASLAYALYGGPGGYDCGSTALPGSINNDDSLTVYLNAMEIYYSPGAYCGGPTSIPLPGAKKGDTVRMVVADEQGHHSGLSSIYMFDGARYVQVVQGFNKATPDGQNNGVQLDQSFAIPF